MTNVRSETLEEAGKLINGDRQADYGTPQENFTRISKGWSVLLETDVTPEQVALCMAWVKLARLVNGPHHDSYVDGCGYIALASELSEEK